MSGILHLVRHGQTTANVAKSLDTRPPGAPLTELGMTQASDFAAARPGVVPAVLLSSVARRAQQTAGLIGAGWGIGAGVVDGVHEIQVGELEGRSDEEALEAFGKYVRAWHDGDPDARPPGGESVTDLLDRYLPVVDELRAGYLESGDVYLVSHGAAIRLVAARLARVDPDFAFDNHLPNTGVVSLRPSRAGWELLAWDTAGLPGGGRGTVDPMG